MKKKNEKRKKKKEKRKKIVKKGGKCEKWKQIMPQNYEKPIQEMSFWQLVFGKCLSGFARFGKKHIQEMSIWGARIRGFDCEPFCTAM